MITMIELIYIADRIESSYFGMEVLARQAVISSQEDTGSGNRSDQLHWPIDIVIDRKTDSLIISDPGNERVMRWPRRNGTSGQTIISGVICHGLAIDNDGYLYVADSTNHEVRRWRIGDTNGILVAGGSGKGNRLDQLNRPMFVFVDQEHSVYISDENNHRVMKWMKGAKKGIIVAGGQGAGNGLSQLSTPRGVIVDQLGTVYVADNNNNRIMCWRKEAKQGALVVGGKGQGDQPNQLYYPQGLSFDRQDNLYISDLGNNRVQRFDIDRS